MYFLNRLLSPSRTRNKCPLLAVFTVLFTFFYLIQIRYLGTSVGEKNKYIIEPEIESFQDELSFLPYFQKVPFHGEIIIHIDLKGAPPKVSYLKDVIPLIKTLGGTGILIEYEDMFPYSDGLDDIRALNAYNSTDVAELVESAERNNLMVIPLVQTLSHFEFILKLDKYKHFREVEGQPEVLCPSRQDVYVILKKMIDQVLEAHPRSKYFHIGCDEAYFLGMCPKCRGTIKQNKWRKDDLYFSHVKKIAEYIVNTYPGVRPIMWGDKVHKHNEKIILANRIPELLDVMLWNYKTEKYTYPKAEDMNSYARLFKNIWISGAFKGATGTTQLIPDPEYHVRNLKGWIDIVLQWKNKINFKGVAVTGWQRYSHFSPLCELLPVALPSLALSLQFLNKKEDFDYDEVKHTLNCNAFVPLSISDIQDKAHMSRLKCDFPGYAVYHLVHLFFNELQNGKMLLKGLRNGDLSFYNTLHNISPPIYIRNLIGKGHKKYLELLNRMEKNLRTAMADVYDEYTIEEWIVTHVMPMQFRLEAAITIIDALSNRKIWPNRPLHLDAATLRKYFTRICNPDEPRGCNLINIH